jgi:hypothetical protein
MSSEIAAPDVDDAAPFAKVFHSGLRGEDETEHVDVEESAMAMPSTDALILATSCNRSPQPSIMALYYQFHFQL